MAYIFIFLVAFFSFDSAYAASSIEYLGDAGSGTRVARAGVGLPCNTGYESCSGDTFYCTTSYSDTKQLSGMPFLLVTGNWTSYKFYHYEDGVKVYSQCKDSYYGQYFGASYSAKPTEEVCLSRPELSNVSLSGVYKDDKGNKYVTIHGCIYEATGVAIICPDGTDSCTATWKPVTVDPAYSDKGDTEDKGDSGDTEDKGDNGNSNGGDNSGNLSGGGVSGDSSGGGSSGGSTSGGSSGGSTSGGSSGGSISGGSSGGSTSGGSSGGSTSGDDGWLGDILGWLQRIWSSVNDLNSVFSFSEDDVTSSVNSYDSQLAELIDSVMPEQDDISSLADSLFNLLPNEWLYIDFDKLLSSGKQRSVSTPLIEFSFRLPGVGPVYFSVDISDYSSVYDEVIRPIVEYAIYALTTLRCYFIVRRVLFSDRG
ncbi:hypothetical protein [Escherichia coli]|uniref:hypothetical protein n=1 Tax=Escherichia coli TaxID=562 RepID=UPI0012FFB0F1|nr:hypothetical protein [Escherichia coli]